MRLNIYIVLSCLILLLLSPVSSLAAESKEGTFSTKDEVIYGNLHYNGQVKDMYVVNSFSISEQGKINDYGSYSHIKNLTDLSPIEQEGETIEFQTEEEHFFYQGELNNKPIPWDISISYFLDGKEVNFDELAGISGDFEIHIQTDKNKDVNPVFFEHYLLQISLTLDPLVFENIQAPKGTEVNEGKNKQITFSVLPDKQEVLITSAQVTNLEMDPIQIVAIPAKVLLDEPDTEHMTDDLQDLSSAIGKVNRGVKSLKDGVTELESGMTGLNEGSGAFSNGIDELDQSSNHLVAGSSDIKNGLSQIKRALDGNHSINPDDFKALGELSAGLNEMAGELKRFGSLLKEFDKVIDAIPHNNIAKKEFESLYYVLEEANATKELYHTIEKLEGTYKAAQTLKAIHNQLDGSLSATTDMFANQLIAIGNAIEESADSLKELENLSQLTKGLNTLASEYGRFHDGLVNYTTGVHQLAKRYGDINSGLNEATSGVRDLRNGLTDLHEGTSKLQKETSDLPEQMELEIEKFLDEYEFDDFDPSSFVSEKNNKIGVVQFILQTEKIELEDDDDEVEEVEEKKGLWDLFINLFK